MLCIPYRTLLDLSACNRADGNKNGFHHIIIYTIESIKSGTEQRMLTAASQPPSYCTAACVWVIKKYCTTPLSSIHRHVPWQIRWMMANILYTFCLNSFAWLALIDLIREREKKQQNSIGNSSSVFVSHDTVSNAKMLNGWIKRYSYIRHLFGAPRPNRQALIEAHFVVIQRNRQPYWILYIHWINYGKRTNEQQPFLCLIRLRERFFRSTEKQKRNKKITLMDKNWLDYLTGIDISFIL